MSSVNVDFSISKGTIKPLHGLNNGPVGYGGLVDVSHYYRELGVPYVRLHDPNWPHPREVDIPQVFPDFNADPADPASYRFDQTDRYIQRILNTGAKIVYRLGVSIEHTEKKYYTDPPADFQKWAQICLGIIRHYTEAWADGIQDGVEYWEIWNEPDTGSLMWNGTFEQYLELYRTTSQAIKAYNPDIKVGGYAVAYPQGPTSKVTDFLSFCRENSLPLDFFSWHNYAASPEEIAGNATYIRDRLDEYGFTATESHFNEWNLWLPDNGPVFAPGYEYVRREAFDRQKNQIGASFVAGTLIKLQDLPVDVANYYDGQPLALYCGIFDYYGVPQKAYRAFKAFKDMLDYSERVSAEVSAEDKNIYNLAAIDQENGKAAVLISHFDGNINECAVRLSNLPAGDKTQWELLVLDANHNLESVKTGRVDDRDMTINISLNRHSVVLIKFA
ncbi:MAG: GH39 family glycosyl hydrolase [Armatimonadota bacterium]